VIGSHGRSGLTVREFCRRRKLAESGFYLWRRELRRRGGLVEDGEGEAALPAELLPVRLLPEDSAPVGGRIEIELAGGRRVLLTPPVDRQSLADVVAVLTATPTSMEVPASQMADSAAAVTEADRC